jgi:large subunit ribosomal protein L18
MRIQKKRRKERKTDYLKRIKFLKGNSPRIVFRRTNRYIISEYVTSKEAQDRVVFGINSKILMNYGWPKKYEGSLKSIPASYFTGFLVGKKISERKLETPIVDLGMNRNIHQTRQYAFIKGIVDSGIKMKYKKDIFPSEERIKGTHMKNKIPFEEIKSNIEKNG